ncbi:MAG TPA: DNA repair protein RecO [Alphaproteobacteria bacterium]|jgi:DNA repair protein RecO (recombination protein O)|nr:DNA repair protein RecO [Alphaproteobacteria bacterium]
MDWRDEGIVLTLRPLGESGAVVTLLTREHGRHAGLARGGAGRRGRALYQTGNRLAATWRARLGEQLGTLSAELIEAHGARFIEDPLRLAALASAAALAEGALPEREPHRAVYDRLLALLEAIEADDHSTGWPADYARWELALLADLGFGLDLARCAVTGETQSLTHVSPRTGRAVSAEAAAPYRDLLLPLPAFLGGTGTARPGEVLQALALTGHFLEQNIFHPPQGLPAARGRLIDLLGRRR